jgi:hypothetical protein
MGAMTLKNRVAGVVVGAAVFTLFTQACVVEEEVPVPEPIDGGSSPNDAGQKRDPKGDADNPFSDGGDAGSTSGVVATPTFSPAAGNFDTAQAIRILTSTPGATIRYTTDGTTPDQRSTLFSSPISIGRSTTLKAVAFKNGLAPSAVATAAYTITIPSDETKPVTFSPGAGTFDHDVKVALSSDTAGATLCYSFGSTDPTCTPTACTNGTRYEGTEVLVNSNGQRLRAVACGGNGLRTSDVTSAEYTLIAGTPAFAPASGTVNPSTAVTITSSTPGAIIHYSLDGNTPSCATATVVDGTGVVPGGPFTVNTTVKAVACKTNYGNSIPATANYFAQPAAPVIENGSVTSNSDVTVNITAGGGASVCYTVGIGAADPACNGATCTGLTALPATVNISGSTIKAVSCKAGNIASGQAVANYTLKPDAPTFNPPSGTDVPAASTLPVTISSNGATQIAYTLDNSSPNCSGGGATVVASAPATVGVGGNQTVSAVGCKVGYAPSDARQATYSDAQTTDVPSFVDPEGTYFDAKSIRLFSSAGATVCYTTNDTAPDCDQASASCTAGLTWLVDSPPASGVPVTITGTILRAIACRAGLFKSAPRTQTYTLQVGKPNIDPAGPAYEAGTDITFTSATTGPVAYHYAFGTNPDAPTCASPLTGNPIQVSSMPLDFDLAVVGCKDGYLVSDVARAHYQPTTARPAFSPGSGTYTDAQSVIISSATQGTDVSTKLCYTLDGSAPGCDTEGWVCTGSGDVQTATAPVTISVSATSRLRAVACAKWQSTSFRASAESSADYTIANP